MTEGDEKFYLDKSVDDFRKEHSETYEILSNAIKKIEDITFLKIGLRGTDGTCFRTIKLFLNDNQSPVFQKSYSGHGKWIDNNESFTIEGRELRSYSGWQYTSQHQDLWKPSPGKMSKDMILSLVDVLLAIS